jgi:hypothetical protein
MGVFEDIFFGSPAIRFADPWALRHRVTPVLLVSENIYIPDYIKLAL